MKSEKEGKKPRRERTKKDRVEANRNTGKKVFVDGSGSCDEEQMWIQTPIGSVGAARYLPATPKTNKAALLLA